MKENSKRPSLLRMGRISERKIALLNFQFNNVPNFWKQRFVRDNWQLILTDKMPDGIGGVFRVYVETGQKKVWINYTVPDVFNNAVYIALAYYISVEYVQVDALTNFNHLIESNKKVVNRFMEFRRANSSESEEIFVELFSFVIETGERTLIPKLNDLYQYMKEWVTGRIYSKPIAYIPSYMDIGRDVIDEQVKVVDASFNLLPIKLRQRFQTQGWRIRVSNKVPGNAFTYGVCSWTEKKIFIKSSAKELGKTVLHEFGHYLDREENNISSKYFFVLCFHKEKKQLKYLYDFAEEYEYIISSSEEYFAELFAIYMTDPVKMKQRVPLSYDIMNKVVRRWK